MFQNDQTHLKNLAANVARLLKFVWPFWDIMYYRVNPLTTNVTHHIETSQLIYFANQVTGF